LSWATFLLFKGIPPFFLLVMLFFIIGYGYGASALTFAIVRQTFPLKEAGIVSGFANTGGFLSAVLLPSIFGIVLDHFGTAASGIAVGYYYGFITPVVFSVIGLMGILFIKEKRRGVTNTEINTETIE
jgi:MFS family permease